MPVPSCMAQSRHQVVVTAPGDVTPAALAAVAEGLLRRVQDVAVAILRAPCVLVDDLDPETASSLVYLAPAASLPGWVFTRPGIASASRREGMFPVGLCHDEARRLWASLGRSAGVQLVNRALLRQSGWRPTFYIGATLRFRIVPVPPPSDIDDLPIRVAVPDLTGLSLDAATQLLDEFRLGWQLDEGGTSSGRVVGQQPNPGELLGQRETLTLTLGIDPDQG